MAVKVRKRKNKDGSRSLYLDIYYEGKRTFKFLHHLKLEKESSADPSIRDENRTRLRVAQDICRKRERQLQEMEYGITPEFRQRVDFIEFADGYLDKYSKKDKRVLIASLNCNPA